MEIKRGRSRVVVLFPTLGIALKFPIIQFQLALRLLLSKHKKGGWKAIKKSWDWPIDVSGGFKSLLLRGLDANWKEYQFFRQSRNPFAQATYISIIFVNVQMYAEPCKMDSESLWLQLHKLTNGDIFEDPHHFENPDNFGIRNGKLRMLDYGNRASQLIITKHGLLIFNSFNPDGVPEEEG